MTKTWKCGCHSPKPGMIVPCEGHSRGRGIRIHSQRLRRMAAARKKGVE